MSSFVRFSTHNLTKPAAVLFVAAVMGLVFSSSTVFSGGKNKGRGRSSEKRPAVFFVTHAPVETILTTPGSAGHSLGDERVLPATPIFDEDGIEVGRLDAELLTSSVDYPSAGDEIRMSRLNFVFGEGDQHFSGSADQILVSGSGYYPGDQSTIATGTALVRPVVGGSGAFHGVSGSALTEHLQDGSWRHTFQLEFPDYDR
ncbi:MAG: hypothetical protein RI897_676 [Verrucomicrobiota bacterium]